MKPKIIIVLEGGLIRNVMSTEEIDIAIIDYDIEGIPEEDLTILHFETGDDKVYCDIEEPYINLEEVNRLYNIIETDLRPTEDEQQ